MQSSTSLRLLWNSTSFFLKHLRDFQILTSLVRWGPPIPHLDDFSLSCLCSSLQLLHPLYDFIRVLKPIKSCLRKANCEISAVDSLGNGVLDLHWELSRFCFHQEVREHEMCWKEHVRDSQLEAWSIGLTIIVTDFFPTLLGRSARDLIWHDIFLCHWSMPARVH